MNRGEGTSALHKCPVEGCHQTFRRKDYLKRHEAMHTDKRPYACDVCGKSFGRRHRRRCQEDPISLQRRSPSPYSPARNPEGSIRGTGRSPSPARVTRDSNRLGLMPVSSSLAARWNGTGVNATRGRGRAGSDELLDTDAARFTGSIIATSNEPLRRDEVDSVRMPILEKDFPGSVNNEAKRLNPVSRARTGRQSQLAAMEDSWQGTNQAFDPSDIMQSAPQLESFLPDTSIDFESFFTSGLNDVLAQGTSEEQVDSDQTVVPLRSSFQANGGIEDVQKRIGRPPPRNSRHYVPIDRFQAYYQMAHWSLPPLIDLLSFGEYTCDAILPNFDMLHVPSMRFDMHATCLSFTLCIVGAVAQLSNAMSMATGSSGVDTSKLDFAPIVRGELTTILMRSFSVSKRMTMSDYNVSLNQSLLLLQAPDMLSHQSHERMRANMFRTTIVNTARQLESFNPTSSHSRLHLHLPAESWTYYEVELYWRRWIQLETRRRQTMIVYMFDMLATIETGIPCICQPFDIVHIPLPAPKRVWQADNAETWLKEARTFRPINLDRVLRFLFGLSSSEDEEPVLPMSPNDRSSLKADEVREVLDPFAMNIVILTILRGIIDMGEGRRERGDLYDLTDLWMDRDTADEIDEEVEPLLAKSALLARYSSALETWNQWWSRLADKRRATGTSYVLYSPPICEDALPIYWLSLALLNILISSSPQDARRAFVTRVNFAEMLTAAKSFARTGSSAAAVV